MRQGGGGLLACEIVVGKDHQAVDATGPVKAAEGIGTVRGSLFDLRTGKPKTLPAYQPVKTFPVEIIDDTITLEV